MKTDNYNWTGLISLESKFFLLNSKYEAKTNWWFNARLLIRYIPNSEKTAKLRTSLFTQVNT